MTVELVRPQTSRQFDPNLQIVVLYSLLGLTLSLALLPWLGSDIGVWMALAG